MSIASGDLFFFGSQFPNDSNYGGGRMTGISVQDGVGNNVFPEIANADRVAGRLQLRKIFAAVTSNNADLLSQMQIVVKTNPADARVGVALFPGAGGTRSAAAGALATFPYMADSTRSSLAFETTPTPNVLKMFSLGGYPKGAVIGFFDTGVLVTIGIVTAAAAAGSANVSFDRDMRAALGFYGFSNLSNVARAAFLIRNPAAPMVCGMAVTTATSGADSVAVNRVEAQLIPDTLPYPASVDGINPAPLRPVAGRVPIFRQGDTVVVRSGGTSESAAVAFVDYTGGLTFSAPLANSYPAGSTVSSALPLGDLQASIGASFSQQTWTKVFSDTLIGSPIGANYNRSTGSISTTNMGAINERWAFVFTSPTAFKLIGETLGQIATGTIGATFSPNNPDRGAPFFTIAAAGWGAGWGISNVLRLNTFGAAAPLWVARTVNISSPGGSDGSVLQMRGTV